MNFIIYLNSFNGYIMAQTKQNSIIKLFCLNSFKEEITKAGIEYSETIANETCDCYLEEFVKKSSHQIAVKKCRLEVKEKIKL